jgi:hypothetical protein
MHKSATGPWHKSEEPLMNLKLVVAVAVLTAMPAFGQAQKGGPPANAPKPTKADIQKVTQTISGDKTKLQMYCDISKIHEQMAKLDDKKDAKALQDLTQKVDDLVQKIGPDYVKLVDGLDQMDENDKELAGAADSAFAALDKQCK